MKRETSVRSSVEKKDGSMWGYRKTLQRRRTRSCNNLMGVVGAEVVQNRASPTQDKIHEKDKFHPKKIPSVTRLSDQIGWTGRHGFPRKRGDGRGRRGRRITLGTEGHASTQTLCQEGRRGFQPVPALIIKDGAVKKERSLSAAPARSLDLTYAALEPATEHGRPQGSEVRSRGKGLCFRQAGGGGEYRGVSRTYER